MKNYRFNDGAMELREGDVEGQCRLYVGGRFLARISLDDVEEIKPKPSDLPLGSVIQIDGNRRAFRIEDGWVDDKGRWLSLSHYDEGSFIEVVYKPEDD